MACFTQRQYLLGADRCLSSGAVPDSRLQASSLGRSDSVRGSVLRPSTTRSHKGAARKRAAETGSLRALAVARGKPASLRTADDWVMLNVGDATTAEVTDEEEKSAEQKMLELVRAIERDVRQLRHYFEPVLFRNMFLSPRAKPHKTAVRCGPPSAHACRMLIGACNPMLIGACNPMLIGACNPMLIGACNPMLIGACNPMLIGACNPMLGRIFRSL